MSRFSVAASPFVIFLLCLSSAALASDDGYNSYELTKQLADTLADHVSDPKFSQDCRYWTQQKSDNADDLIGNNQDIKLTSDELDRAGEQNARAMSGATGFGAGAIAGALASGNGMVAARVKLHWLQEERKELRRIDRITTEMSRTACM